MKRILNISLALFAVTFSSFNKGAESSDTFAGRVVVKGPCGQVVISIISPNAGEANVNDWRDPITKKQHRNVFTVQNFCAFTKYEEGETFNFKVVKNRINPCNSCLVYRPVPATKKYIQVVPVKSMEASN
jgi:hypothetical protein